VKRGRGGGEGGGRGRSRPVTYVVLVGSYSNYHRRFSESRLYIKQAEKASGLSSATAERRIHSTAAAIGGEGKGATSVVKVTTSGAFRSPGGKYSKYTGGEGQ
jgi:hypothetical protein